MKRRKGDLATEATHAKAGMKAGGLGEALIHPMKSHTIWAYNIQASKTVNSPSRIKKRMACNRKNRLRERP